jgi:hypothetical protein
MKLLLLMRMKLQDSQAAAFATRVVSKKRVLCSRHVLWAWLSKLTPGFK